MQNIRGNEIAAIIDEYKPAGRSEIEFNGQNLSSVVHFYQLRAGDFIQTKRMIFMK